MTIDEEKRYTAGYVAGLKAAKKGHTYHPYFMFDFIWARGFKSAVATFNHWTKGEETHESD